MASIAKNHVPIIIFGHSINICLTTLSALIICKERGSNLTTGMKKKIPKLCQMLKSKKMNWRC